VLLRDYGKKPKALTSQDRLRLGFRRFVKKEMPLKKKQDKADYVIFDPKEDSLIKDTTVKEKFRVFEISKRISRYLSALLFATGAISMLLSVQYLLGARLLLSFELKTLFMVTLSFIGAVNLISGLLLLARE
jgi:hypothetical protein